MKYAVEMGTVAMIGIMLILSLGDISLSLLHTPHQYTQTTPPHNESYCEMKAPESNKP
jgi:hypothetical protein